MKQKFNDVAEAVKSSNVETLFIVAEAYVDDEGNECVAIHTHHPLTPELRELLNELLAVKTI